MVSQGAQYKKKKVREGVMDTGLGFVNKGDRRQTPFERGHLPISIPVAGDRRCVVILPPPYGVPRPDAASR